MVAGVCALVLVTNRLQGIASIQRDADAVALAYVSNGAADAQRLAAYLHVEIVATEEIDGTVTVTVRNGSLTSVASASH
jgi:hypothetical protein